MGIILSSIISRVDGFRFPAISLVSAKITTTDGLRLIASALNRTNIYGVVCLAIHQLIYGLPAKKSGRAFPISYLYGTDLQEALRCCINSNHPDYQPNHNE